MSDNSDLSPILTTRPIAPYLGGKRNLAKRICAIIDKVECQTYAEPFVGMGGIFLRRKARPKAEVINDKGRDVANLFRILQRHYPQFLETLRFQITTRAEFDRLKQTDPDTLTDLERAARFLYLQRTAFGGRVDSPTFGVSPDRTGRFNLTQLEPMLEDLHSRLAGVVIECLDYAPFLQRYDRPQTLFYLDPPYFNCESDYGEGLFTKASWQELAEAMGRLKGRVIMSVNDHPEIRSTFAGFTLQPVKTTYTVARAKAKTDVAELLISNFDLPSIDL